MQTVWWQQLEVITQVTPQFPILTRLLSLSHSIPFSVIALIGACDTIYGVILSRKWMWRSLWMTRELALHVLLL